VGIVMPVIVTGPPRPPPELGRHLAVDVLDVERALLWASSTLNRQRPVAQKHSGVRRVERRGAALRYDGRCNCQRGND
jgi:hypothetical protein